jgi:hypothetical protein
LRILGPAGHLSQDAAASGRPAAGNTRVIDTELAWAVLYHDLHATPDRIGEIRRVDTVDIDGRVYQITRLRGEALAVVVIDDQPDPDATPPPTPA